ncbi:MAG: hypothetical protein QXL19_10090 [Ignisphaera sp.]
MQKFVVLGPFTSFDKDDKYVMFFVNYEALVSSRILKFSYTDLYKIYRSSDNLIYIVCSIDESQLNYYKPYLSRIPSNATEIDKLYKTRCPKCGCWKVYDDDPDDMICPYCDIVPRNVDVIWRARHVPSNVIEGEGIYFLRNLCEYAPKVIKELTNNKEKLGNLEAEYKEFIGWLGKEDFGVYREYNVKELNKVFYIKIRNLTIDEKLNLLNELNKLNKNIPEVKLSLARSISREKAREVVIKEELYKQLPWELYYDLDDNGELRELTKKYYIEKASSENDPEKAFKILYNAYNSLGEDKELKELIIKYGAEALIHIKNNVNKIIISRILKDLGYEDENVRNVIKNYEESIEMMRKREKEKEEREKKIIENIKKQFNNLPISISIYRNKILIKLDRYVKKKDFNMFIEYCKKLGFRFDPNKKQWWKNIEEYTEREQIPVQAS